MSKPQQQSETSADPILAGRKAAAAMLAVSSRTLDRLRTKGVLPASAWIGKRPLWKVADLREFVNRGGEAAR
jgi:hypothetical protein